MRVPLGQAPAGLGDPRLAAVAMVSVVVTAALVLGAGTSPVGPLARSGVAGGGWPAPAMVPAPCPASDLPGDSAASASAVVDADCLASVRRAVAIVPYPDGSGRLLVASQDGQVWVAGRGQRSAEPLLDLGQRVALGPERGLLGLAVAPSFPADPRVFVDYTTADEVVVAAVVMPAGAQAPLRPEDERVLLVIPHAVAIHNGGSIAFGPDGWLYVAVGDGGLDPATGERPPALLGTVVRLDPGPAGRAATVQAGDLPPAPEVVASGLRNPWRISFDAATGDLWLGDVGASAWEEIDVIRSGASGLDFGWPLEEGTHCVAASPCAAPGLTAPVAEYAHSPDAGCAVVGGVVDRGGAVDALRDRYVFGDYCSGRSWTIPTDASAGSATPVEVGRSTTGVSSFAIGPEGEVYVADVEEGTVSRIVAAR